MSDLEQMRAAARLFLVAKAGLEKAPDDRTARAKHKSAIAAVLSAEINFTASGGVTINDREEHVTDLGDGWEVATKLNIEGVPNRQNRAASRDWLAGRGAGTDLHRLAEQLKLALAAGETGTPDNLFGIGQYSVEVRRKP